jgi:hypothetical protein
LDVRKYGADFFFRISAGVGYNAFKASYLFKNFIVVSLAGNLAAR